MQGKAIKRLVTANERDEMTNKSQVEWKQNITVRFWADGLIPEKHHDALEEAGLKRATEMIEQGCTSGELFENICAVGDPEEGIEYLGWWEVKSTPHNRAG